MHELVVHAIDALADALKISFEWSTIIAIKELVRLFSPSNGPRFAHWYFAVMHSIGWERIKPLHSAIHFGWLAFCGYGPWTKAVVHLVWRGVPCIAYFIGVYKCRQLENYMLASLHPSRPWIGFLLRIIIEVFLGLSSPLITFALRLLLGLFGIGYILFEYLFSRPFAAIASAYWTYDTCKPLFHAYIFVDLFTAIPFPTSLLAEVEKFADRRERKALNEAIFSSSQRDPYQYQPLLDGEIRLLKLQHASAAYGTEEFSLVARKLSDRPKYNAVSYTWQPGSDPTAKQDIIIEGSVLSITSSAYEILVEQAGSWDDNPEVALWIDSVCINQNDMSEKGKQVGMMREIYSMAQCVMVYISPPTNHDDADVGVYFMKSLEKNCRTGKPRRYGPFGIDIYALRCMFGLASPGWNALNGLVNNKYWSRAWIVQEIANATRLRIFYGENEVSLEQLLELEANTHRSDPYKFIDLMGWGNVRGRIPSCGFVRIVNIARKRETVQDRKQSDRAPDDSLLELLLMVRDMDATDPRDRVFAIQGLKREPAKLPKQLQPDYSISTVQLYRRVAIYLLELDPVSLLSMAGLGQTEGLNTSSDLDLPSWVPNWTMSYAIILPAIESRTTQERLERRKNIYCAIRGNGLEISSKKVGEVQMASKLPHGYLQDVPIVNPHNMISTHVNDSMELFTMIRDLSSDHPVGTPGLTLKDLCSTMLAGAEPSEKSLQGLQRFFEFAKVDLHHIRRLLNGQAGFTEVAYARRWFMDCFQLLQDQNFTFGAGRKLTVISSGCFALVPESTEPGDVIHHVKGSGTCFVLRPAKEEGESNARFQLVGQCYVHGWSEDPIDAADFSTIVLI